MKKIKFIAAALAVLFVFNAYALPRSKAVVIDATAAFGAAAATAAINGTTATTLFTGMSTSAATTAMTTLMGEYATATGAAASGTALAGTIGAGTIITSAGALVLTAAAAFAVYKFIGWLREEKGLEPGGHSVTVVDESGYYDGDIKFFLFGYNSELISSGTLFRSGTVVSIGNHTYQVTFDSPFHFIFTVDGTSASYDLPTHLGNFLGTFGFGRYGAVHQTAIVFQTDSESGYAYGVYPGSETIAFPDSSESRSLSLQSNSEFQTIPQEIPEGQAMVISGIENLPQADPQAAADVIMQSAIDGALAPTVNVEPDPTVTPDPDPDPDPDPEPTLPPDDLPPNLPQLGDVLTSRFPFSIPWDVGRVLDFLSAEPVAPHVEFKPFKGDLFGIPAGSVSVDYDFSKYEDIASFCRTFEIVGFCLLLAVGTKRLIWTA